MSNYAEDQLLLTFWGTRGSIPTPGRTTEKYGGNTSCLEVLCGEHRLILDGGTGIRNLGMSLMGEKERSGQGLNLTLLLSHTHWDHIQGLPFFVPAYVADTSMKILGSPDSGRPLADILEGLMDPVYFPVKLSMLGADLEIGALPGKTFSVGDMSVTWQEQHYHPGGSLRFAVEAGGRKLVYASDVELEAMFYPTIKTDKTEAHRREYLEFIANADLLVADGQYTSEDYSSKQGWGHTAIPALLEIAHSAGVKRLAVFHHDPLYTDRKLDQLYVKYSKIYTAIEPNMDVFWAREGMTLAV